MKNHLAPETVFGYEHGLLSPAEVQAVHRHVAACEVCRQRLAAAVDIGDMVFALRQQVAAPAAPRPGRGLIYAAAAPVVLAAALAGWLELRPKALPAVIAGRLDVPAFIGDLNPPPQTLMGEAGVAQVQEMGPRGTAVLAARPMFHWPAQSGGGWKYRVQVFGPGPELMMESPDIATSEWTPDRDLAAGINYQRQVDAQRGEERVTLPGPPDNPPRFRVVDRNTAARIGRLAVHGRSHLELAAEYARAGLLENAQRELDAAIQERPADMALRRLRDGLH